MEMFKKNYFVLVLLNSLIICLCSDIGNNTPVDKSEFNSLMQQLKLCVKITTDFHCLTRNAVSGNVSVSPDCNCKNVIGPSVNDSAETVITCKIDKDEHQIHVFMKGNITVFECKQEKGFFWYFGYLAAGVVILSISVAGLVYKYKTLSQAMRQLSVQENIEMQTVQEEEAGPSCSQEGQPGPSCCKEGRGPDKDRMDQKSQSEERNVGVKKGYIRI